MPIERHQTEEQADIRNAGIWLEDGEDAKQESDDNEGLPANANGQPTDVARQMQPEYSQEKGSEGVEHFHKEIPPKSNVGR